MPFVVRAFCFTCAQKASDFYTVTVTVDFVSLIVITISGYTIGDWWIIALGGP